MGKCFATGAEDGCKKGGAKREVQNGEFEMVVESRVAVSGCGAGKMWSQMKDAGARGNSDCEMRYLLRNRCQNKRGFTIPTASKLSLSLKLE